MLTRSEKEAIVQQISSDMAKSKGVFLTNLIGVPANDAVAIRKQIRDVKGKVIITKNTIFEIAMKGTGFEKECSGLKGPHAIAFAFEDVAAVAKCIKNAAKEHDVIEFKAGMLDNKVLSVAEVIQLSELPSRDEMLGVLFATFNAPVSALARVLNSIKEQKEESSTTNTEVEV